MFLLSNILSNVIEVNGQYLFLNVKQLLKADISISEHLFEEISNSLRKVFYTAYKPTSI